MQEGGEVSAICRVMFLKDNVFKIFRTLAEVRVYLHGMASHYVVRENCM